MQELTDRQMEVLDSIKDHIRRHGVPPTRTELAHRLGLAEASSVTGHLKRLSEAGRITVLPGKRRAMRVLDKAVPLLGALAEVAAGTPIVCEQHIVEHVPVAIADRFPIQGPTTSSPCEGTAWSSPGSGTQTWWP